MKVKIFDLIELSKIIDILGQQEITISDSFEVYKFQENIKAFYSFLNEITKNINPSDFDKISNETVNFDLPNISVENILTKYRLKLSDEQSEIIHRILSK